MVKGSMVGGASADGRGFTAVHELGHALGLSHTFAGTPEKKFPGVSSCTDKCFEPQVPLGQPSSTLTGDLCPDTRPAPVVFNCSLEFPVTGAANGNKPIPPTQCETPWVEPPLLNVMAFSNVHCPEPSGFTPCQHARMRCFLDSTYGSWHALESGAPVMPSPIVLAPTAAAATATQAINVSFGTPLFIGSVNGNPDTPFNITFAVSRVPAWIDEKLRFVTEMVVPEQRVSYQDCEDLVPAVAYSYTARAGAACAGTAAAEAASPSPPSMAVSL